MRVSLEPLRPVGPSASIQKLDEHAGYRQSGMQQCSDSHKPRKARVPGAELVIPQVDDSDSSLSGNELVIACAVVAGIGDSVADILLRVRWQCRSLR